MLEQTKSYPVRTLTPGWNLCRGFGGTETVKTPSGEWLIEYIHGEWKHSEVHGFTYRYSYAVTFVSDGGRRIEYTMLGSRTRGEIISTALWAESTGWGTVTNT